MTRLSKIALLLVSLLSVVLLSLYSLRYLPLHIVENIEVVGSTKTYEISKMTASLEGLSFFKIRKGALESNLENLSYVRKARALYDKGTLYLDINLLEDGFILESASNSYFLSGDKLSFISKRDASALKDEFMTISISDSYLDYIARFGFDGYFKNAIDSLISVKEYQSLIDKAEYDNNKSTGKGELTLTLSSLNAIFRTSDVLSDSRLLSSLRIIEDEQKKSSMFSSAIVNYELRSNQLVRLKG